MLNKRHKAALFITLVLTGSSLLAGAALNEGLGILILGIALTWVFGSRTIVNIYRQLRDVPGKSWPWTRALLIAGLGGLLLVFVAHLSSFNSFIVAAALAIYGLVVSGLCQLPTQNRWARLLIRTGAAFSFLLAAIGGMEAGHLDQDAERLGELALPALIAFNLGMFWLIKGWKLIVQGISASSVAECEEETMSTSNRKVAGSYFSFVVGFLALTSWLGLLAFTAFSDAVYPHVRKAVMPADLTQTFSPALFLMFLAWWPYASWRKVLLREANSKPHNLKRHKLLTVVFGALFVVVLSVTTTFGVQNGDDRRAVDAIEENQKEFASLANQIGAIKSRAFKTTADYIDAYTEMEPLLNDFDQRLTKLSTTFSDAKRLDEQRGPLNIQRLYRNREKELLWDTRVLELLREDTEVTRRQVQVAKQMSTLPSENQVEFWKANFLPLINKEDQIRQQIASFQDKSPFAK